MCVNVTRNSYFCAVYNGVAIVDTARRVLRLAGSLHARTTSFRLYQTHAFLDRFSAHPFA